MTTSDRTALLSRVAYAGMFVFGVVMALLGSILPSLPDRLSFRVEDIGTLFLAMNFAMLACSALLGAAMDRFGMKPPLVGGPLLVALAIALIPRATRLEDLILPVVLLGAGGGALNGATNTLVADLHEESKKKSAALNLLGVFFGFGALFLPFVIGSLIAIFGIDALLYATAALCLMVGAFAAFLDFPAPKQRNRLPIREMPQFLRSPLVLAMGFLLFFQSGIEFTMGGYISTYLTRGLQAGVVPASWILAAYWASIMIARVALSRYLLRAEPHLVVFACAITACVGSLAVAMAPGVPSASLAIVITGMAMAGIYPTVLGIAGSRFREHSGTVFGILFSIALVGGMLLPWIAGQATSRFGLRAVFFVVAAAFGSVSIFNWSVSRMSRRELQKRPAPV